MKVQSGKEKGVSEVLGSILVLLITVTLFSSVFYYVSTMPTPKSGTYSEFDAKLKYIGSGANMYAIITVKNVGGESLENDRTKFIVVIDGVIKRHELSEFGNQSFAHDNYFSQGEEFTYYSKWDGVKVTASSTIAVMLYDDANSRVIWTQTLHGHANLPGIVIGIMSNPQPIMLGKYAVVKAIVIDPNPGEDASSYVVGVDLSSLNESSYVKMKYAGHNMFVTREIMFDDTNLDVKKAYPVTVYVKDREGRNVSYRGFLYITRGTSVKGADIFIDPAMVSLSKSAPVHGSDVTVTVTVQNRGGTGATFKLEVLDEYSGYPSGTIKISTNLGNPMPRNGTYTVAAAGQTIISFLWKGVGSNESGTYTGPVSGTHHLIIKAIDVKGIDGSPEQDRYPDTANIAITVLPKLLFVDADQAVDGTPNDVSKYYRYLLTTCDYGFDEKRIMGDAVLTYRGTLSSYDVIIWETGYYGDGGSESAISVQQMNELKQFYNHEGALWIISSETTRTVLNKIGLSYSSNNVPYSGEVIGVKGADINLTLSNGKAASSPLVNDRGTGSTVRNVMHISGGHMLMKDNRGNALAVYMTNGHGGKLVYFGFEFSRLEHYYTQYFVGFRILGWLANISGRVGMDVAVDDMKLSTDHPLYMQNVTITAVVSNNGGMPISTDVLLKIDGIKSPNIISENPNNTGVIPANGGYVFVNFTWVPKSPGEHTVEIYADPYNMIKETNEENNILDSSVLDTKIFVEFSTLIVYNSTHSNVNTTDAQVKSLLQGFRDLGYAYTELNVGRRIPTGYVTGEYFSHYNLVIWQQVGNGNKNIGNRDARAIYNTLKNTPVGFMFIGPNMPEMMAHAKYGSHSLLNLYGVQVRNGLTNHQYVIFGYNNENSITNGLAYVLSAGGQDVDKLIGTNPQSYGLFRIPAEPKNENPLKLEEKYVIESRTIDAKGYGLLASSDLGTKGAILPFSLSQITGIFGLRYTFRPVHGAEQARAQLLFHLLKHFGQLEQRPELAVYEPEIEVSSEVPEIIVGHSYMVRATIHNFGAAGASVVVRFYDDYEWIGTKSVYVPGNNKSVVEMIWTPNFASKERHIRVVVDPLNEVREIWNARLGEVLGFNNEAIMSRTVWYFWDDMEHGAGNWEHEATLVNINGETPLDFLARKDVDTNVVGDWDWSKSGLGYYQGSETPSHYHVISGKRILGNGVYLTNDSNVVAFTHDAAHTQPSAYWLPETEGTGGRKPIDLVIVIDNSGSMLDTDTSDGRTRLYHAKEAAKVAVGLLKSQDRVAIFCFQGRYRSGTDPERLLSFTYVNNPSSINNTINNIPENSYIYTPLFDTIAAAAQYARDHWRSDAVHGMIILTDGHSNSDEDYYQHAPGRTYTNEPGASHYWYVNDDPSRGEDSGLKGMPWTVFAVGLGRDVDSRFPPIGNTAHGPNSTYVHTDDAARLESIFRTLISQLVQQAGGVRAISEKVNSTMAELPYLKASGYNIHQYRYRFLTTPPIRVGAPYLAFWNYASGEYPNDRPDHIVFIDYKDTYYWYYKITSSGSSLEYHGHFLVLHNNSDTGDGGPLSRAPVTYIVNPTPWKNTWLRIKDHYSWKIWHLPPVPHAKADYLFAWEDLWGTTSHIDADGDEWVRVTLLEDDTFRVVPYRCKGGYEHVFFVGSQFAYKKPHGATWLNSPDGGKDLYELHSAGGHRFPVYLRNAKGAILSFWTRYWMTEGTNGGFIYLWGSTDGVTWSWNSNNLVYVKPKQPYTGNVKFDEMKKDAWIWKDRDGNLPYWCFNGRSGGGTFDWEYVEADLSKYIGVFKEIRIVFVMAQYGGLPANGGWHPEMGWYIDDVKVKVIGDGVYDLWRLENLTEYGDKIGAHSGNYAWVYNDTNENGNLPEGIDSSLISKQIDLTSARNATLDFWIRFNLDPSSGLPPASVLVEVSSDGGTTWSSLTYGVRIGWGSSGHGGYAGKLDNGKTNAYGWVSDHTLLRINCDLSGWAGETIILRFRVVTNATTPDTWDPNHASDPHGVYIDDVYVWGESYAMSIPAKYFWTS